MTAGITDADIEWAFDEAERLAAFSQKQGVWMQDTGRSQLVAAVEFLRLKAGPRSELYLRATDAAKRLHGGTAMGVVINCLTSWVDMVDRGYVDLPIEAQARLVAATDLMEQVEQLLNSPKVIPAAPVMLAGAALEELLRSMVDSADLKPRGKPGIGTYTSALRGADLLTAQEAKDITSWAGMRNAAAHGQFDQIESANARLMAQAINLFMQKHSP